MEGGKREREKRQLCCLFPHGKVELDSRRGTIPLDAVHQALRSSTRDSPMRLSLPVRTRTRGPEQVDRCRIAGVNETCACEKTLRGCVSLPGNSLQDILGVRSTAMQKRGGDRISYDEHTQCYVSSL